MWGFDAYGDCEIAFSVINSRYTIGIIKFGAPVKPDVGKAANGNS